ncbi:MAG TPA: hypothetical protein EYH31_02330, partial [Anaerolineae bacterium]|nr:hypothetical protein [Anaerolineae bacterium]
MKQQVLGATLLFGIILVLALPVLAAPMMHPAKPSQIRVRSLSSARLEGLIELQLRGSDFSKWVVNGQGLLVDENTIVRETYGKARVGAWVVAEATILPDQSYHADLIVVMLPAGAPGMPIEFSGEIEAIQPERWQVRGLTIYLDENSVIKGIPEVGALATVRARYQANRLLAEHIQIVPSAEWDEVEFVGVIEEIAQDHWTVDGRRIFVVSDTEIVGYPQVGAQAEVRALLLPDETLKGRWLHAIDPTSTPQAVWGRLTAIITSTNPPQWLIRVPAPGLMRATKFVTVPVDTNTLIDESGGVAEAGVSVQIVGHPISDYGWEANRLRIQRLLPVQASGVIQQIPATRLGWWQIGNRQVLVHEETAVQGKAELTWHATVQGNFYGDGSIWATQVAIQQPPSETFEGVISQISHNNDSTQRWVVKALVDANRILRRTVILDSDTIVNDSVGEPSIGARVRVDAFPLDDETYVAW